MSHAVKRAPEKSHLKKMAPDRISRWNCASEKSQFTKIVSAQRKTLLTFNALMVSCANCSPMTSLCEGNIFVSVLRSILRVAPL